MVQTTLEAQANPESAVAMSAYMRNQFPYLGIDSPTRRALVLGVLREEGGKKLLLDLDIVRSLAALPEREYFYAGLDYLDYLSKSLTPQDFPALAKITTTKPWWDSIDYLRKMVSATVKAYPQEGRAVMNQWLDSDNFWLRRIPLNHMLGWKGDTDREWLARAILSCAHEKEFFIAKAIGWSLREYAKTDPDWVREFVEDNRGRLQPLSVREGLKHL